MPKKSKKKGKRPSTSGDAPAKRGSAAPPPPPPAAPDDGPVFDDAFEDEYMEEDVVVGDEGEGEGHARRLIEADMEAETLSNTRVQDPRRNAKGGELDFDPRAYRMLHRLGSDWPCLSFDFVRDAGGGGRTRFPHALLAACGTQAVGDAEPAHAAEAGGPGAPGAGLRRGRVRRRRRRRRRPARGRDGRPRRLRAPGRRQPRGGLRAGAGARGDVVRPRRRAGLGRARPSASGSARPARGPRGSYSGARSRSRSGPRGASACSGATTPASRAARTTAACPRCAWTRAARAPSTSSGRRRRAPSRTSPGRPRRPRSS